MVYKILRRLSRLIFVLNQPKIDYFRKPALMQTVLILNTTTILI